MRPTLLFERKHFRSAAGFGVTGAATVEPHRGRSASPPASPYRLLSVTAERHARRQAWQARLDAGRSVQKLYQSPAFFDFLCETEPDQGEHDLIEVQRRADGKIVGLVPVRLRNQPLPLLGGTALACAPRLPVLVVLGSIPLLDDEPGLWPEVAAALLAACPQAVALQLPCVQREAYDAMRRDCAPALCLHVTEGWRQCHTLPLPASYAAYLQQFSAKKRYNLQRQIRQLDQAAGALAVTRIARPDQVGALFHAFAALLPPARVAQLLAPSKYASQAAHGLLRSYVITGGDEVVAVVTGTVCAGVWHVHNIYTNSKYLHLSVGTSALQLALRELIGAGDCHLVDFGFGTPAYEFRSSHVFQERATVIVTPRFGWARLAFGAHGWYERAHAALAAGVKRALQAARRR
jgi:CelD/BcsL family acetyltransferase involved in cellulose biosynthesis